MFYISLVSLKIITQLCNKYLLKLFSILEHENIVPIIDKILNNT